MSAVHYTETALSRALAREAWRYTDARATAERYLLGQSIPVTRAAWSRYRETVEHYTATILATQHAEIMRRVWHHVAMDRLTRPRGRRRRTPRSRTRSGSSDDDGGSRASDRGPGRGTGGAS